MDYLIAIVAFLFLVGVVITIHEGGHFLMAQVANIKVLEFSIGFGKKIFSTRFGKDNTLFTLRLLPLGGFVKPLEEAAMSAQDWQALPAQEKARSFGNSSKAKKFLMVAGGPSFNFILAFLLYVVSLSFIGTHALPATIAEISPDSVFAQAGIKKGETIETINGKKIHNMNEAFGILANQAIQGSDIVISTNEHPATVIPMSKLDLKNMKDDINKLMGLYFISLNGDIFTKGVDDNSPAQLSGLKEGDIIKSLNGQPINDLNQFIRLINRHPEEKVKLLVQRNKQDVLIEVTPKSKKQGNLIVGKIGATFKIINSIEPHLQKLGFIESLGISAQKVGSSTYTTVISLAKLATGQLSAKTLSGPVAIADYSGRSAQLGIFAYLSMMAAISIAVGVFNLIPLPVLDGGFLVQYILEGIRGKNFTEAMLKKAQLVGITLLSSLFAVAIINDLSKYLF